MATRQTILMGALALMWMRLWGHHQLVTAQNKLVLDLLGSDYVAETKDGVWRVASKRNPNISGESIKVPVQLYNRTEQMNELMLQNVAPGAAPTEVVLIHGFGAGIGHYHRNYKRLVEENENTRFHALDMMGCGGLLRPAIKYHGKHFRLPVVDLVYKPILEEQRKRGVAPELVGYKMEPDARVPAEKYRAAAQQTVEDIELYYVDLLEEWRKKRGISKMVLVGHLFGGYMLAAYALRYPENISKLVLLSPVGVERGAMALTNPEYDSMYNSQQVYAPDPDPLSYHHIGLFLRLNLKLGKFVAYTWQNNYLLFGVIRGVGPFMGWLVLHYTYNRFQMGIQAPLDIPNMHLYVYHLFRQRSTLEHAIQRVLAPNLGAKVPILDRVQQLLKVPKFYAAYGLEDWMNTEAGRILVRDVGKQGRGFSKYKTIESAGHNLMIDNPTQFGDWMDQVLRD